MHWEQWNWLAKYIPIAPAWLWYCIRSRSLWFFTPSNPTLTFGGFFGESKREMYKQLPPKSFPTSIFISPSSSIKEIEQKISDHHLSYPIAVKPDVGMMGFMFRRIENKEQLYRYHKMMPVDYIIQEHIDLPIEVSVFYYRFPGERRGTITGFLKKEFLEVIGNGKSTLLELMTNYPRIAFRMQEMKSKHILRLHTVIPEGEVVRLSPALNLSRGGKLVSLAHENDEKLLAVFDAISNHAVHFYYGRYDIKCASVDELKVGLNFSILEYNGCGAEPIHVYGNGLTLLQAYRILLQHWSVLSRISMENNKKGIRYWKNSSGYCFSKNAHRHFKRLKQLDATFQLN